MWGAQPDAAGLNSVVWVSQASIDNGESGCDGLHSTAIRSVHLNYVSFGGPHAERLPVLANLALLTSVTCRSCNHTTSCGETHLH